VNGNWYALSLSGFTAAPRFLASLATQRSSDSAHVRYQSLTSSGVQVKAEEDTTADGETGHTPEAVASLAIQGDGTLTAATGGASTTTVTKYYYLGGQRVAMRVGTETTWIHGDHLGSASLTTDDTGRSVGQMRYYPYGETRSGSVATDRRFAGQRAEDYTQLYQMGVRWYDPALARWTSPDSIVPEPGNPQALNRFAYVLANPLRYTDPTGHWWEDPETGALLPYAPSPALEYYGPDWDLSPETEAGRDEVFEWFDANPYYHPGSDSVLRDPEAYGVRWSPASRYIWQFWDEYQRYWKSDHPFRDAFVLEGAAETGIGLFAAAGRAAEVLAYGGAYGGVRNQPYDGNQQAVIDLVREASARPRRRKSPLSHAEADALVGWAREYGLSVDVGSDHVEGGHWYPVKGSAPVSHIHIAGKHVPVVPGYRSR